MKLRELHHIKNGDILKFRPNIRSSYSVDLSNADHFIFKNRMFYMPGKDIVRGILVRKDGSTKVETVYSDAFLSPNSPIINDDYEIF